MIPERSIIFAASYGAGIVKLMNLFSLTEEEAKEYVRKYSMLRYL